MHGISRCLTAAGAIATILTLAACSQDPTSTPAAPNTAASQTQTGNGAPSGPHYNLNVIGVPKDKTATMDGSNGHVIFVPLWGNAKIYLCESGPDPDNCTDSDFAVLDANGTDHDGATFALPNPDPDGDGVTAYSVYVRGLGKPGGKATVQSCYTDDTGTWCALDFAGGVDSVEVGSAKGPSKFRNVSKDLLYVDYCTSWSAGPDGILGTDDDVCDSTDQIALFSDDNLSYLWDYDNQGLKLAQFRFYPIPTTTPW